MPTKVQDQSPEVMEMAEHWPVLDALLGGTSSMRKAGRLLLPQEPREDDEDYSYRLKVATLFPAYSRTTTVMAGKPFSKPLTLSAETPSAIVEYADDIDQQGRNLHSFFAGIFQEAVDYGLSGVLVDFPTVPETVKTQADENAIGARPYFVHIRHNQILGWMSQRVNGSIQLTQLRLAETKEVPDGMFSVKCAKCVRVLEPGKWSLYQENEKTKEYDFIEEGKTTLDYIPFVPFYGVRKCFMVGMPPLLNLAYQNIKHWQAQSDQDDSARFARKRLLVFAGVSESDLKSVTAASNFALRFDSPATTVTVVQGSAEAVTVGRKELEALEAQMIQTGAELLVAQPGQRTATEANNDAEGNKSQLLRIVESFEDAIDEALQVMADWIGEADGGDATLFKDFTAATLSDASAQLVVTMQQGGLISKDTAIREQQRRGILSSDIDPMTEAGLVQDGGPSSGMIGNPGATGSAE